MARNIKRRQVTVLLAFGTNPTTASTAAADLHGLLAGVKLLVPNLDSTNTATLNIKDADGDVVYTKAAIAKSTTHIAFVDANNQPLRLPLSGNHTIEVVTSGSQTADRTFTATLLINEG